MKSSKMIQTRLVCPDCGNIQVIYRKVHKRKPYGHLKRLWCYRCKKVTNHFEIGNEEIEEAANEDC